MKTISYNREDIEKFNIHQLRDIGRRLNIKSPATKKRAELLDLISKRFNGEYEPYTGRAGRPAKATNMDIINCLFPCLDEIEELSIPKPEVQIDSVPQKQYGDYPMDLPYINRYALCSPKAKYEAGIKRDYYDHTITGNLFVFQGGFGAVREDPFNFDSTYAMVSRMQIIDNNFRTGDYVTGTYRKLGEKKVNTLVEVDKSKSTERRHGRMLFDTLPFQLGSSKFHLQVDETDEKAKFIIREGGRFFTQFSNKDVLYKSLPYFLNQIDEHVDKTIVLDFNALTHDQIYTDKVDTYKIGFEVDNTIKILMANFVIELAKREAEKGKKIMLIFTELSQYMRIYDYCVKLKVDDNMICNSIRATNDVMKVSRFSVDGSITLLVMDSVNVPSPYLEAINYDVIPFFNCAVTAI